MDQEVSETEISTGSVGVIEAVSGAAIRPAVEVMAPVDLPEGYQFQVRTGHRTLDVQVPVGGVQAGQRFAAWVVMDGDITESLQQLVVQQSNYHHQNAALRWRDGFFECFKFGFFHPMCCLAFWCVPCVLGQVMTRAKLTLLGNPRTTSSSNHQQQPTFWTPFKFLFALTALYIFIRGATQTVINYTVDDDDDDDQGNNDRTNSTQSGDDDDDDDSYPAWADAILFFRFLIFCAFSIFTLVLMIKTRRHLRHKDHIPAENCGKMEDCCVSFWCPWCTVCHMARHTANYNQVEARCCTDTGLPDNAPMYV